MYTQLCSTSATESSIRPLSRLGARRLTRAHLAVAARPALAIQGAAALAKIRGALEQQLGAAISMQGRVLETTVGNLGGLSRSCAYALIELGPLGCKAVLEVELSLLGALLDRIAGGPGQLSAASRLTRIEEVAFSFLCLIALGAVRTQGAVQDRFGPRLLSVHLDRNEILDRVDFKVRHLPIEVLTGVGGVNGLVRLLVPTLPLQACAQQLPIAPVGAPAEGVLAASVPLCRRVGRTTLAPTDLAQLETGDVVMFEGLSIANARLHGPGRLVASTFELSGHFTPDGFLPSTAHPRALSPERTMSSSPHDLTQQVPQLPVEVEIELTRIRLTVGELAGIRPGHVLPLHINAAEPVSLWIGDRAVARAELVEIEGEVGARILAVLP